MLSYFVIVSSFINVVLAAIMVRETRATKKQYKELGDVSDIVGLSSKVHLKGRKDLTFDLIHKLRKLDETKRSTNSGAGY